MELRSYPTIVHCALVLAGYHVLYITQDSTTPWGERPSRFSPKQGEGGHIQKKVGAALDKSSRDFSIDASLGVCFSVVVGALPFVEKIISQSSSGVHYLACCTV